MRRVFCLSLSFTAIAHSALGEDGVQAAFSLESQRSDSVQADYASVSLSFDLGKLSFGRPRSALDSSSLLGTGTALTLFRSQAAAAADTQQVGAGLLIESNPVFGLSLSGSVHADKATDDFFASVTARYEIDSLGPIDNVAIYGGTENDGASDIYRLGTSLTRGVASAVIDFTAETGPVEKTISGVFLGLEVNDSISVAVSGEVEDFSNDEDIPTRFGIGAAYDLGRGQVISGSVGDVTGDDPRFGFMLGLEF